ncbi:MAG: GNAT family N-acetyltransferase [Gulosibacter sp.]|uniref:GNAT family N-acetyltransferase n=1 Tax=Gulosibacter sp. TaxID=2817531 RepID=UPI003F92E577
MSEATASETTQAEYSYSKDPTNNRYVVHYDDEIVGFCSYRELGDGVHFDHTVVDQAHQGTGIASKLVRFALDDFGRTSQLPVIADCSYVQKWLTNHPEYVHLTSRRPDELP